MANIQFQTNMMHAGVIFKGPVIEDNRLVSEGMVIDPSTEIAKSGTPTLKVLIPDLVDRGIVRETSALPTHSASLVNGASEAIAVTAPSGSGQTSAAVDQAARPIAQTVPANPQPVGQPDGFPVYTQPAAPALTPTLAPEMTNDTSTLQ